MESLPLVIFNVIIHVAMLLIFLRFIIQMADVDRFNPVVQSTYKATRIVDTFGRILPTLAKGRFNLAALILIVLLRLIDIMGSEYLTSHTTLPPYELLVTTLLTLINDFLRFCKYIIFGSIILSWVTMLTQSRSPFIDVVYQLAEPLLAPFRRILPDTGPLDFSPIVALLAIYIAQVLMQQVASVLLI